MTHDATRLDEGSPRGPTQDPHRGDPRPTTQRGPTQGTHTGDPNRGPTQRGGPHRGPATRGEGHTGDPHRRHTHTHRQTIIMDKKMPLLLLYYIPSCYTIIYCYIIIIII